LGVTRASRHMREDEKELRGELQEVAAVEWEESENDAEGEESYQELNECGSLIPVSLSLGRKKVAVEETPLLQKFTQKIQPKATTTEAQSVVEIFSPQRPS